MLEHPVYVRVQTEDSAPYFENQSSAEAVISALINAQHQGWLRLHGFVVLPDAMEVVISPIRQGVSGVIAHIQSEMIPILSILLRDAVLIWDPNYIQSGLITQKMLVARLEIMRLKPVALGLVEEPEAYSYSSVNPRYQRHVAMYAGFAKSLPPDNEALITGVNPAVEHDDTD